MRPGRQRIIHAAGHRKNRPAVIVAGVAGGDYRNLADPLDNYPPEKRPDGKYRVWGQIQSGRYLQVIYVHDEDDPDEDEQRASAAIEELDLVDLVHLAEGALAIYVIHARELEPEENRQWRRRTRSKK